MSEDMMNRLHVVEAPSPMTMSMPSADPDVHLAFEARAALTAAYPEMRRPDFEAEVVGVLTTWKQAGASIEGRLEEAILLVRERAKAAGPGRVSRQGGGGSAPR